MDFHEAETRFRSLEKQRARGKLPQKQYRAELNQLRVTDQWGRLWMPQERTGQWHIYQNGRWMPARPPHQAPPQTSPPPPPSPMPQRPGARPAPRPASQPQKGGGCGKFILYLIIWAVFWGMFGVAVFIFIGQEEPLALAGVAGAALLSLVLMLASLSSAWEGTIIDIRTERVRVDDDDAGWHWENVRFAYVRRANGKTKKMRPLRKWQVGDRLVKRRGETQIRHYPRQ